MENGSDSSSLSGSKRNGKYVYIRKDDIETKVFWEAIEEKPLSYGNLNKKVKITKSENIG
jgi:hypothetical protein